MLSPRIAVVVQQQIDGEVAGVGFSLNPLANDYDEAVIDANWGLGESVVAGLVSPDHFIVDKVSRQVGRSLTLTIPRKLAEAYGLEKGEIAEWGVESEDRFVIKIGG